MSVLTWNGVSSATLGVTVEQRAAIPVPQRRYTVVSVPGRNGDVLIPDGSYSNMTLTYNIHLSAESTGLASAAHAVGAWLAGPEGYAVLDDSNYSQEATNRHFVFLAYFVGPANISNILAKHGQATVTFSAKPGMYNHRVSDYSLTYDSSTGLYSASVTNDSSVPWRPRFEWSTTGIGPITVSVGNRSIEVSGISWSSLTVKSFCFDCDQRFFGFNTGAVEEDPSGTWMTQGSISMTNCTDFPEIKAGETATVSIKGITPQGGASGVKFCSGRWML